MLNKPINNSINFYPLFVKPAAAEVTAVFSAADIGVLSYTEK